MMASSLILVKHILGGLLIPLTQVIPPGLFPRSGRLETTTEAARAGSALFATRDVDHPLRSSNRSANPL